jgi:hypothetical protein
MKDAAHEGIGGDDMANPSSHPEILYFGFFMPFTTIYSLIG